MKRLLVTLLLVVGLTGCATCQQHPKVCVAATAVAIGAVYVYGSHGDTRYPWHPHYGLTPIPREDSK